MAGSSQFKAVHNEWDIACKVWVGGLGEEGTRLELEEAFTKFGPVKNIWLAKNPPSFAFIEMEDPRDAEDSVAALNGTEICGMRAHVEMARDKDERRKRAQEKQLQIEMDKRKRRLEEERRRNRSRDKNDRDRRSRERSSRREEQEPRESGRNYHSYDQRDYRNRSRDRDFRDDRRFESTSRRSRSPMSSREDFKDRRGSSRDSYYSYRREHDRW